jgi:hypothetical protein
MENSRQVDRRRRRRRLTKSELPGAVHACIGVGFGLLFAFFKGGLGASKIHK